MSLMQGDPEIRLRPGAPGLIGEQEGPEGQYWAMGLGKGLWSCWGWLVSIWLRLVFISNSRNPVP